MRRTRHWSHQTCPSRDMTAAGLQADRSKAAAYPGPASLTASSDSDVALFQPPLFRSLFPKTRTRCSASTSHRDRKHGADERPRHRAESRPSPACLDPARGGNQNGGSFPGEPLS